VIIDFHPLPGTDWIAASENLVDQLEAAGFRAVIAPNWSNGWTRAGSWIRDLEDDGTGFRPMLDGEVCCGCGERIVARSKAICRKCAPRWKQKYRKRYVPAKS
jgi:hypothetical protein